MPENALIVVCIVENWSAFVITRLILDFLHFTTNATPSVRSTKRIIHECLFICLFLIDLYTNTSTQFLGRNALKNSLGY
jgi:hypothetical protein